MRARRTRAAGPVWAIASILSLCGCTDDNEGRPWATDNVPITCNNFCTVMLRHCRGIKQMYASLADCQTSCAAWPDEPTRALTPSGNSLQCRFVYATMAPHVYEDLEFCANASASGGTMCHD